MLTPDGRVAEHLTTCPNCAAALVSARALERMLRVRSIPKPPAQFTTRTLARVRRARWRSEQFLDVGFNVAIAAVVLTVIAGVWILLNRSGLAAVSNDAVDLFSSSLVRLPDESVRRCRSTLRRPRSSPPHSASGGGPSATRATDSRTQAHARSATRSLSRRISTASPIRSRPSRCRDPATRNQTARSRGREGS